VYLQDCIQLQKFAHYNPEMLPLPRSIEGSVSIRDIWREIVHVITTNLRGPFQAALELHAYYTNVILQTIPIQDTHAQLLIFILDSMFVRCPNVLPVMPVLLAMMRRDTCTSSLFYRICKLLKKLARHSPAYLRAMKGHGFATIVQTKPISWRATATCVKLLALIK